MLSPRASLRNSHVCVCVSVSIVYRCQKQFHDDPSSSRMSDESNAGSASILVHFARFTVRKSSPLISSHLSSPKGPESNSYGQGSGPVAARCRKGRTPYLASCDFWQKLPRTASV